MRCYVMARKLLISTYNVFCVNVSRGYLRSALWDRTLKEILRVIRNNNYTKVTDLKEERHLKSFKISAKHDWTD